MITYEKLYDLSDSQYDLTCILKEYLDEFEEVTSHKDVECDFKDWLGYDFIEIEQKGELFELLKSYNLRPCAMLDNLDYSGYEVFLKEQTFLLKDFRAGHIYIIPVSIISEMGLQKELFKISFRNMLEHLIK